MARGAGPVQSRLPDWLDDPLGLATSKRVERAQALATVMCGCEDKACFDETYVRTRAWFDGIRKEKVNGVEFDQLETAAKSWAACAEKFTGKPD